MIKNLKHTQQRSSLHDLSLYEAPQYYDMVVFCHLRWQFVYQRPQHIISRMAQSMKILFIEEPIDYKKEDENSENLIQITENLHVLQLKVRDIASMVALFPQYIKNKTIPVGWFYSPSFIPVLKYLSFDTIVYDCMDELSLFKGAPASLIADEKCLIVNADIIFTGGKSLYDSKKQLHPNVYCFPSSVDESHFATALNGIEVSSEIATLSSPIVGYFGVIDERIDLDLLHNAAKKMPHVSFVMIGPFAKIEESDLPKEDNIHYLGMKSYNELPNFLKAFDIAMMPFALNDATKYISPTKTLEYMAAGKPIISTKIKDVVSDYSNCVHLVETAEEFCESISNLLNENNFSQMRIEYSEILNKTSWNSTVEKMKLVIKNFANENY